MSRHTPPPEPDVTDVPDAIPPMPAVFQRGLVFCAAEMSACRFGGTLQPVAANALTAACVANPARFVMRASSDSAVVTSMPQPGRYCVRFTDDRI